MEDWKNPPLYATIPTLNYLGLFADDSHIGLYPFVL
jgi:hypothetical protein